MDDKAMSRSMKSMWIMIVIFICLLIFGFIIIFIVNSSSEANSLSKLGADFRILNVQKINYEDVNVTLKKISYEQDIESIRFIFYDSNESEIKEYEISMDKLNEEGLRIPVYIENTSRIKKVSVYSYKKSKYKDEIIQKFQDIYEVKSNNTIFLPIEDETGYSREKVLNCSSPSDCKDNDPCTIGSCSNGLCSYPVIPGCEFCGLEQDCEDNNSCTNNLCFNRKCNYTLIEGCEQCISGKDCDDENPCTEDNCIYKKCENKNISGCEFCSLKSDCEDNNSCTENICSNKKCTYLSIPGCISCSKASECEEGKVCVGKICVVAETNSTNESNYE